MDTARRKELLDQWKNRCPEMGVISFHCKATGESFLGASKDMPADFNGTRWKLIGGIHPNKQLQQLWNQHGEDSFEQLVIKTLKFKDPTEDYTPKLEALRDQCLEADPKARKIWK